jgi:cell division protein FtsI/penicillin-binding protein 2
MELPIWILAVSQILVDIFIILLILILISVTFALLKSVRSLSAKGEKILDNVDDAIEYAKESAIFDVLRKIFAPNKKSFKYFKKHKNDRDNDTSKKKKKSKDSKSIDSDVVSF